MKTTFAKLINIVMARNMELINCLCELHKQSGNIIAFQAAQKLKQNQTQLSIILANLIRLNPGAAQMEWTMMLEE
jgi:hypothetical protein